MIEFTLEAWDIIQDRLNWLEALEMAGVENWDGIDEAREIYLENQLD